MVKFYKQVNEDENVLGVYISSPKIDKVGMTIVKYFLKIFDDKTIIKQTLKSPIFMLFDPTLQNNKLEIKVSSEILRLTLLCRF